MPDYTATITITVPITARNPGQAQERAGQLENWVKVDIPKTRKWAGDVEIEVGEVTED